METHAIIRYKVIEEKAKKLGLQVKCLASGFKLVIPAYGSVDYGNLDEMDIFLHGYEVAVALHKRNAL